MDQDRLPDDAIDALAECARSVVARQQTAPEDDIFIWTRGYGSHGDLSLEINLRLDGDRWVAMPRQLHML
jgi:hypothetical protein